VTLVRRALAEVCTVPVLLVNICTAFCTLYYGVFEPPFGGLRGKVGALSIPRWKARDRLPINDK